MFIFNVYPSAAPLPVQIAVRDVHSSGLGLESSCELLGDGDAAVVAEEALDADCEGGDGARGMGGGDGVHFVGWWSAVLGSVLFFILADIVLSDFLFRGCFVSRTF